MDSAIESVRKRYQITVTYTHISKQEAALKMEAIVGALSGFLRRQRFKQPGNGEEE